MVERIYKAKLEERQLELGALDLSDPIGQIVNKIIFRTEMGTSPFPVDKETVLEAAKKLDKGDGPLQGEDFKSFFREVGIDYLAIYLLSGGAGNKSYMICQIPFTDIRGKNRVAMWTFSIPKDLPLNKFQYTNPTINLS